MSHTLEFSWDADSEEEESLLALFSSAVDDSTMRVAWTLSTCIAIDRNELKLLVTQIWGIEDVDSAVEALVKWPLVNRGPDGLFIDEPFADSLAQSFYESEPGHFKACHELLISFEEDRSFEAENEEWFSRGRIAYYLAAIDPMGSTEKFGEAFAEPPVLSRMACRLWLSDLAIRQEQWLGEDSRAVLFYRGFRLYILSSPSRRIEALPYFNEVLEGDRVDSYSAIALHLVGAIHRQLGETDRAIPTLRNAVDQSLQLRLRENEIMARHSMTWSLVQRWQREGNKQDLQVAARLAEENLDQAREYGDAVVVIWCERTALLVGWLASSHRSERDPSSAAAAAANLSRVAASALDVGEYETGVLAVNDAMGILRDVGAHHAAVEMAQDMLSHTAHLRRFVPAFTRVAKTVGSIKKDALDDPAVVELADVVLGEIDRRTPFRLRRFRKAR